MQPISPENITTDDVSFSPFTDRSAEVAVLRLDKLHPLVSGNKWFKLRFYLEEAQRLGKRTLLSFGGAWSNHLLAVAAACRQQGLKSIGIIRGEEPAIPSATILQLRELGMELHFVSRRAYRDKPIPAELTGTEDYLVIPEGGYGNTGAKGAATIAAHFPPGHFTHICCAAGTGTMAAGLLRGTGNEKIEVISALKNQHTLSEEMLQLAPATERRLTVHPHFHFGGFARWKPELLRFMNDWYIRTGIPSDFVYTGKLFFAVSHLLRENYFPTNSRILLVHSGGLQGNRSLPKGTLIF